MTDNEYKQFFSNFPGSTVLLTNWDVGGGKTIPSQVESKSWEDWSVHELVLRNRKKKEAVFFTTCGTRGAGHKNKDFDYINSYHCEIDLLSGPEEDDPNTTAEEKETLREKRRDEFASRIMWADTHGLLPPSLVVSTRNGYHVYWLVWREEMLDELYNPPGGLYAPTEEGFEYIQERIAEVWSGDVRAKKKVQLMRVPGFLNHKKGKTFPVMIDWPLCNYANEETGELLRFCEDQFFTLFGPIPEKKPSYPPLAKPYLSKKKGDCIFKQLVEMPQDLALEMVSGTALVNGERYQLSPVGGGIKKNIHVVGSDGKLSSGACHVNLAKNCVFVPKGSGKGSPNILEWIKWYHPEYQTNPSLFATDLKKVFNTKS